MKQNMMKLFSKYKVELLAFFLALSMSASLLFVGNCPYPYWDSIKWLSYTENIVRSIFGEADDKKDAYFVNVGYDKQLIEVKTNSGIGNRVITNRKTLLDFLTIAERADYKYIFLDIRFEKGDSTEWDKALYSKIAGMKNIVFAHHYNDDDKEKNDVKIADSILLSKSAYNDYYTTLFSSNFTRYQYLQDGRPSVALRMYQEIDGKTIEHIGLLYYSDGTLCENCPYIPIKGGINPAIGDGTAADYLDLGPFLMAQLKDSILSEDTLIEDMKGKIVVVGDFEEDKHDTYMGKLPGPYLTYIAYKYLAKGGNKVSIIPFIILTIIFFLIVWQILRGRSVFPWGHQFLRIKWMRWLQWLLKWKVLKLVSVFFSYSVILTLICVVFYLISETTFSVEIPALVISALSTLKRTEK